MHGPPIGNKKEENTVTGIVRKIAESYCHLRHISLSVCPHGKSLLPTEGFFMTFDIGVYFENLSRESYVYWTVHHLDI